MESKIWAIGGGKGGTGKTFVTSSLGTFLARQGKKVIIIDADLGGANLHSFVKQKRPKYSLTDFFTNKIPLHQVIEKTQISNLELAAGDIHSFDYKSINRGQKLRFFNHIRKLDCDYILLDLGAGSNLNVIDTFLLADNKVVVILPEVTSEENLYQFLKKVFSRKINLILHKHRLKDENTELQEKEKSGQITGIVGKIEYLKSMSFEIEKKVEEELAGFKISLILNQVRSEGQIKRGFTVRNLITEYFGIETKYSGYIKYNENFWRFVNQAQPLSQTAEFNPTFTEVSAITGNILENKQLTFTNMSHG
ncbi:MAG: AAA family ATPase [Candidatus Aminicenantes bacterium]|nr:AAA family ATPase [Candidatus Aminicenantes bacterium]